MTRGYDCDMSNAFEGSGNKLVHMTVTWNEVRNRKIKKVWTEDARREANGARDLQVGGVINVDNLDVVDEAFEEYLVGLNIQREG